ncbi:MAG: hypothetical protein Q7S01_01360 [bacterium]|nr:hypothetical protein [bacterium]
MNKRDSIFATFVLLIALFGCAEQENINLVDGVAPVSTAFVDIEPTLREMAAMAPAERASYLARVRPRLALDVVQYLRNQRKITRDQKVNNVTFFFGSLKEVSAESHGGGRHQGYFNDQLVARVEVAGAAPIEVIVKCLNGLFMTINRLNSLQTVGNYPILERFKIGRHEGLVHHVSYQLAMDIAQRFNLPLYRGRGKGEMRITPDQARVLESETDRVRVRVHVVEGDRFDLVNMTFTPSPLRGVTRGAVLDLKTGTFKR